MTITQLKNDVHRGERAAYILASEHSLWAHTAEADLTANPDGAHTALTALIKIDKRGGPPRQVPPKTPSPKPPPPPKKA